MFTKFQLQIKYLFNYNIHVMTLACVCVENTKIGIIKQ